MGPRVDGECDPRFEPVRQLFDRSVRRGEEIGASVCVWHGGRKVVDLWGGYADRAGQRPWERDTLGVIFSSTKGLTALCGLKLAAQGKLDYDAPVAQYWPGFGQHGKAEITVRTLLNHRAGLVGLDQPIGLDELEAPERLLPALEGQRPHWEPGTAQGYHGVTYGPYASELIRRAAGRSLGAVLREEIAEPLGADVHLGLAPEHDARVSRLYPSDRKTFFTQMLPRLVTGLTLEGRIYRAALRRGSPTQRAFANPKVLGLTGIKNFDTPRVRRMELAWANGIANARGLARVYAALIGADGSGGDAVVSRATWEPVTRRQSWQDKDRVLLKPMGWSQGFLKEETRLFSPNPEAFGHPGAGGALGWADPKADVAIGYVMNKMDFHIRSPRALALCRAVYRCMG